MPVFKRYGHAAEIFANEIMSSPVLTVGVTSSIRDAADEMWTNKIGSLVVVDREGKIAGIITERDIIFAYAKNLSQREEEGKANVESIMSRNAITAAPEENVESVVEKMRSHNIRHIPIVNKEGKPVGIISIRNILDTAIGLLGLFRPPDLG